MSGRQKLIDLMSKAVLSDRNKVYGEPEKNFQNIADVWNWWFEGKEGDWVENGFTALAVAHMMTLMKMARLKTNPTHFDSQVDAAGYQACAADFVRFPEEATATLPPGGLLLRLEDGAEVVLTGDEAGKMVKVIRERDVGDLTYLTYLGTRILSYRHAGILSWQRV